jgi:hypothetical protein
VDGAVWKNLCIRYFPETRLRRDDHEWRDCLRRKCLEAPTSFSDLLEEQELGACAWYRCPNGHLYAIGECKLPMVISKCPTCASLVGGADHATLPGNQRLDDAAVIEMFSSSHLRE